MFLLVGLTCRNRYAISQENWPESKVVAEFDELSMALYVARAVGTIERMHVVYDPWLERVA